MRAVGGLAVVTFHCSVGVHDECPLPDTCSCSCHKANEVQS